MRNIILVFLWLQFLNLSCLKSEKEELFTKSLATKYQQSYIPIVVVAKIQNKENRILIENTDLYNFVYKNNYTSQYNDFFSFLKAIKRKEIILTEKDLSQTIYKVLASKSTIYKLSFAELKSKHLVMKDTVFVFNENSLPIEDKYVVIDKMLENEFYPVFDDYSGIWTFYKRLKK